MKVRCIKRKAKNNYWNYVAITIGKIYEVLKENNDGYLIEDDNGNAFMYYEKYLFEIVEEEKMEVMQIKSWEDLDDVKNNDYRIGVNKLSDFEHTFYISLKTNKKDVSKLHIETITKENVINWLKLFGFNIEFVKSPLEQVKEEIEKRISMVNKWGRGDDEINKEIEIITSELKRLIGSIERIEKDEH